MINPTTLVAAGLDNNYPLAWIVKVSLDSATKYYSSIPVTISSVDYVGGYILKGGLGDISQGISIIEGGAVDIIGAMTISLNEIVTAPGLHSLLSPFGSDEWINRKVEIGLIYNDGSTLDTSDVNWIYTGRIDDADITRSRVTLQVIDYNEITNIVLPKTTVQKADYPSAPSESIGMPVPIVYAITYDSGLVYMKTPGMMVNENTFQYLFAGHAVSAIGSVLIRESGMNSYWRIEMQTSWDSGNSKPTTTVGTSSISGPSTITLGKGPQFMVPNDNEVSFNREGSTNTVTGYTNLINGAKTSTTIANTKNLSLIINGLPSGKIKGRVKFRIGVAASSTFRFGYAPSNLVYVNLNTYAAVGTDQSPTTLIYDDVDTSEMQSREFILNCAAVGESATIDEFVIEEIYISVPAAEGKKTLMYDRSRPYVHLPGTGKIRTHGETRDTSIPFPTSDRGRQ